MIVRHNLLIIPILRLAHTGRVENEKTLNKSENKEGKRNCLHPPKYFLPYRFSYGVPLLCYFLHGLCQIFNFLKLFEFWCGSVGTGRVCNSPSPQGQICSLVEWQVGM